MADAIYYRFADLETSRWMSGYPLQMIEDQHKILVEQGSRPYYFVPWQNNNLMTRFTASWVRDGKPFKLSLHCDRPTLEKDRKDLPEGFRPTSIEPYRWDNELRYAAIWTREEPVCEWRMSLDLDQKALESRLATLKTQGFRPAILNAYRDLKDELKWAAVWIKDDAQTEIHFRLSQDELQKKIDSLAAGWRPLWLDAFLDNDSRYYAAIFISDGRIYEWKVALAKPDSEILAQLRDIRSDDFWPVQQTVTPDPRSPQPVLNRAGILSRSNRHAEALAELDRGVARLSGDATVWLARARFHRDRGQAAKAAADYAQAIKLKSDDDAARLERGQLMAYGDATTLIGAGGEWRWLHPTDGADPKVKEPGFHSAFFRPEYDDSKWNKAHDVGGPSGGFGYGEQVGVNIGNPPSGQRKTAYFRHKFSTTQPLEQLVLTLQCDDGVIVYLDGKEVGRVRISGASAKESYDLLARYVPEQDERKPVALSIAGRLEAGEHLLALSLHNTSSTSSDLRMADVVLRGSPPGTKPARSSDPQVLADIGRHHEQSNRLALADEAYSAALELAPTDAEIALRRGRLRASQDRLKEAIDDFTVVLAARPQDADLVVQRAVLSARVGRREAALADIAHATKLRPNDDLFRHRQGQLYAFLDTNVIVAPTSNWKWLHPTDGADPATTNPRFHTTFPLRDFDDSAWRTGRDGNASGDGFAYGQTGRVRLGEPVDGKRYTAYFRHKFSTDAQYDSLNLRALVDDGLIVYLDGVEVGRYNMRSGREAYGLMARRGATRGDSVSLALTGSLGPGDHVLALSLHNNRSDSSDLRLRGVTLTGRRQQSQQTTLDDVQALLGRAETYLQLGQVDRGIADLSRAIELAPGDVDPLSKRADALARQRRWKEAAEDLTRLIERFEPRSIDRFEQRGECHENAKQWDRAIADFTTALSLASDGKHRGRYLHMRGICWSRQGEWQKASSDYWAALNEPQWVPHPYGLNDSLSVFAHLRQTERQAKVLDIIFQRYSRNEPIPAEEVVRSAALQPLTPERADLLIYSVTPARSGWRGLPAVAYYRAGRYQDALDSLSRSTERLTEHSFVRALALHRSNRADEALQTLAEANETILRQQATAAPGEFPAPTWFDWLRVLVWQKEANEAIVQRPLADLNRAIVAAPTNAAPYFDRARLGITLGNTDEAVRDLSKAIELDPKHAGAYALRGDLYASSRKWELATADYRRALALAPDDASHASRLDRLANEGWLQPVAADAEKEPVRWRHSLTEPESDWAAPGFDDSDWKSAPAPFGSNEAAWDFARTEWATSEIWLRREFQLAERPAGFIVVRTKFDDQIKVFVNGVLAVESTSWGHYRMFPCSASAAATLSKGRNVIAVYCRNNEGPCVVDVGIHVADPDGRILTLLNEVIASNPSASKLLAQRGELNLRLGRWAEAAADLDKVLAEIPPVKDPWYGELPATIRDIVTQDVLFTKAADFRAGDITLWVARARHLGSRGRWRETAEVMAKLEKIAPHIGDVWYRSAALNLYLGRNDDYRRACQEYMDRFSKSDNTNRLERIAKVCALARDVKVPLATLRELSQRAIDARSDHPQLPWFYLARGLVEYRAGQFDAACETLANCVNDDRTWPHLGATARLLLAMANAQSGKTAEAARYWDEARELARRLPAVNSDSVGRSWHDALIHHIIRQEAEATLPKPLTKDAE